MNEASWIEKPTDGGKSEEMRKKKKKKLSLAFIQIINNIIIDNGQIMSIKRSEKSEVVFQKLFS